MAWQRDGTDITPDERVQILSDDLAYKLAISDCRLDDAQTYSITLPSGQQSDAKLIVDGGAFILPVKAFLVLLDED